MRSGVNLRSKSKRFVVKRLEHTKRLKGRSVFYREIGYKFFLEASFRSSELFKKIRRRRNKDFRRHPLFGSKFRSGFVEFEKSSYATFLKGERERCSVSIVSLGYFRLTREHLEGIRLCLRRNLSKKVVFYRRVFPWLPLHTKPLQVRMGKGKGSKLKSFICFLKPGMFVFDIVGFYFVELRKLTRVLLKYLPFSFKLLMLERL